MTENEDKSA